VHEEIGCTDGESATGANGAVVEFLLLNLLAVL